MRSQAVPRHSQLAEILRRPFGSRWVFDVEIITRWIRLNRFDDAKIKSSIYEYPLHRWVDITGSKVKPHRFLVAFADLVGIYRCYFLGGGPSMSHEASLRHLRSLFTESARIKEEIATGPQLEVLAQMAERIAESLRAGGKLLLCGNGGSAADAQHLAAEMLVRLRLAVNREAVPALALAPDASTLTACANDLGFDVLYERMVQASAKPGDIVLGITTSGRSPNVIRALQAARQRGAAAFAFLGCGGGAALAEADLVFVVPSDETGRIQESHIAAGHGVLELVEEHLLACGYLHRKG